MIATVQTQLLETARKLESVILDHVPRTTGVGIGVGG